MVRPGQSGAVGRIGAVLRRALRAIDAAGLPPSSDSGTAYVVGCGRDAWRQREPLESCPYREPRMAYAWRYGWMSAAKGWRPG